MEGNPEQTLVDVVEVDDEDDDFPDEPEVDEYSVLEEVVGVGVCPVGPFWQLILI